ncbi:hypothetical protein [Clostridium carnis]
MATDSVCAPAGAFFLPVKINALVHTYIMICYNQKYVIPKEKE